MAPTLQSYINATAGPNAADLSPLVTNDTYRKAVDQELAVREAATTAATAAAAREADLFSGVQPFASAMGAIRTIAKRFPETSKHMDDAAKAVQAAMGVVAYNPQPLPQPTPATPLPSADSRVHVAERPIPAPGEPIVDATGAQPTLNAPKP